MSLTLSSFASQAFDTARSTFKGLAQAAVTTGDDASATSGKAATKSRPKRPEPAAAAAVPAQAESTAAGAPHKGRRLGTVLDSYA